MRATQGLLLALVAPVALARLTEREPSKWHNNDDAVTAESSSQDGHTTTDSSKTHLGPSSHQKGATHHKGGSDELHPWFLQDDEFNTTPQKSSSHKAGSTYHDKVDTPSSNAAHSKWHNNGDDSEIGESEKAPAKGHSSSSHSTEEESHSHKGSTLHLSGSKWHNTDDETGEAKSPAKGSSSNHHAAAAADEDDEPAIAPAPAEDDEEDDEPAPTKADPRPSATPTKPAVDLAACQKAIDTMLDAMRLIPTPIAGLGEYLKAEADEPPCNWVNDAPASLANAVEGYSSDVVRALSRYSAESERIVSCISATGAAITRQEIVTPYFELAECTATASKTNAGGGGGSFDDDLPAETHKFPTGPTPTGGAGRMYVGAGAAVLAAFLGVVAVL